MTGESDFVGKATLAWEEKTGSVVPDWVVVLADVADAKGLRGAGGAIGYSASLVSNVIANKYLGDIGRVEGKVRGALMGAVVICPRLEEITRDICLDWQGKPFAPTSPQRVEMYHLCRSGCPHFRKGGSDGR